MTDLELVELAVLRARDKFDRSSSIKDSNISWEVLDKLAGELNRLVRETKE